MVESRTWQAEGALFTERRLGMYASGVALGFAALLLIRQLIWRHFILGHNGSCLDFTWIWLSSKMGLLGALDQAYNPYLFSAARVALVGPPNCTLLPLDYPPTLLFFTYPFGLMSYTISYIAWISATLILYLAAVYAIIPRSAALIAAITPYPIVMNVLLGHNGFLTAGLIGFALAYTERRPWLSGIFLGLLSYKPQFGILFPFALFASRNWRVLLSATATTVMFGIAAAIAFGDQVWPSFLSALVERASSLSEDQGLNSPLMSVFGQLRSAGASAHMSWAAQLAVTAIVVVTVCVLWARPIPHSLKAAGLAVGAVLAAPHAIGYDACILSIAVAFLVGDGLSRGFLPGERTTMLMCWFALFIPIVAIPAILCVILLVLVVRRAVRCPAAAPTQRLMAGAPGAPLKITP